MRAQWTLETETDMRGGAQSPTRARLSHGGPDATSIDRFANWTRKHPTLTSSDALYCRVAARLFVKALLQYDVAIGLQAHNLSLRLHPSHTPGRNRTVVPTAIVQSTSPHCWDIHLRKLCTLRRWVSFRPPVFCSVGDGAPYVTAR